MVDINPSIHPSIQPPVVASDKDELPIELRMMMQNERELASLARQHGVKYASDTADLASQEPIVQEPPRNSRSNGEGGAERGRGRGRGRGRRINRVPSPSDGPTEPEFELPPTEMTTTTTMTTTMTASNVTTVDQTSSNDLGPRDDVLWRIGDEQFLREFRRQKCIAFAGEKMSKAAADVVSAMLALSAPKETKPAPETSEPVTIKQICEKSKLELATVRRLIDLMRTDALHMVLKASEDAEWTENATFVVHMGNIIASIKARAIHAIAEARYGTFAARICELLSRKKYLDQQKVGEMAILPAKTAREQLYLLYREGWITYLDISKRSDFNVGSTYWFWTLDHANLDRSILEHLYHTVYNLRVRRHHEFIKGKDLVEFAQAGEGESERLQRLSTMLARLDKGLLEVDETILLFARY